MQTFAYQAKDKLGNIHDSSIDADSMEEARSVLASDGLQLLSIEEESSGGFSFGGSRITKHDIIYMTSQLSVMIETGINLSTALDGIASQEKNDALKKLILGLKKEVEGGEDFSSVLAKYPKYFDQTYIALIRASEQTGLMGEMLEKVAVYLRKEAETKGKIRAALAYPAVMILLACGVTIFLLTFVLPKFEPLFNRKGVKLPGPTVFMMTASDFLLNYWMYWIPALVASIVAFFLFKRSETGKKVIDTVKLNVPIIGPMVRKVTIARSLNTLGTLVRSDVPMLQSLELTSQVCNNANYSQLWRNVIDAVTSGSQIHESLRKSQLFPATIVQMIAAGEETGRLDDVLEKVSTHYEHDVDLSIKTTTSLIEPIMIAVMGVVVGGIALALLMPIFSLSRNV
ncbi:type II secretion system F family protein [Blastopirellula marina]|uniref:General secretion pathway protein F n=1 Tax=Blastopirellula marina TaxID=124 RepID=A0A2S8F1C0_9BACT|nr:MULTISPECIES: type II secretion system F family protein [Pirellulaceae]PQO25975.1 type II secretion system F family protein [Blastopirellula marina]RCS44333.1 type II secretion system F family protein [Bremerella cremea]